MTESTCLNKTFEKKVERKSKLNLSSSMVKRYKGLIKHIDESSNEMLPELRISKVS